MTDCHMPAQTAEGGLVVNVRHQPRSLMSLDCAAVRDAKAPAKAVEKGEYWIARTFEGQNAANSLQKRPAGLYLMKLIRFFIGKQKPTVRRGCRASMRAPSRPDSS